MARGSGRASWSVPDRLTPDERTTAMPITLPPATRNPRATYRLISGPHGLLAHLQPFSNAQKSMHAHRYGDPYNAPLAPTGGGQLPSEHIIPPTAVYVVWSYRTPIGWVTADGAVVVPDVRYSVTTTKQQRYVRSWLGAGVAGTSMHAHHVARGYRPLAPVLA